MQDEVAMQTCTLVPSSIGNIPAYINLARLMASSAEGRQTMKIWSWLHPMFLVKIGVPRLLSMHFSFFICKVGIIESDLSTSLSCKDQISY